MAIKLNAEKQKELDEVMQRQWKDIIEKEPKKTKKEPDKKE